MHKNEFKLELKERESKGMEIIINQRVITSNNIHDSSTSILSSDEDFTHNMNSMCNMENVLNSLGSKEAKYDAMVDALFDFKANKDWTHNTMVNLINSLCHMNDI